MPFDILESLSEIEHAGEVLEKDYRRILEFQKAAVIKDGLLAGDEAAQADHRGDLFALANKWIKRACHVAEKLKGNPLSYVGSDPFPSEREAVRVFLEVWDYVDFPEGKVIVDDMG